MMLAIAALAWASGDHGTHCVRDSGAVVKDAGPYLHPIVTGCIVAGLLLAGTLLALSAARRRAAGASRARPGVPSAIVAGLTLWCAAVYLPLAFGSTRYDQHGLLGVVTWPPVALLIGVGALVVFLQYLLFLPLLGPLCLSLTRRPSNSGYRSMQVTVVYAMLGCIAVAIGSDLLLTGFCLGD
ncbi:MAG: hypothetical protein QOI17_971 [Gaiellales bacterium]|nr:hypothetical protein [Gaiellales bacterium]